MLASGKKDSNESWLPYWKGSWQQESSRSLTLSCWYRGLVVEDVVKFELTVTVS